MRRSLVIETYFLYLVLSINPPPTERLKKDWRSPIYAFFRPDVAITYVDNRRAHDFTCAAQHCKGKGKNARLVRRYLDTGDKKSTSSLRRHAKVCWGDEVVERAVEAKDIDAARRALHDAKPKKDGSLTAVFGRTGKGKISYSHRQHTTAESR